MIKLVVFDLDGTLVDSLTDIAKACNDTLEELGYPTHAVDNIKSFVGDGARVLVERLLPATVRGNLEVVDKAFLVYRRRYSGNLASATAPYNGIVTLLNRLKQQGIHTAVLSNKPHIDTIALVDSLFPDLIDLSFGQRDTVPRKPNPAGLLEIMEQFLVTPKEVVYVGDTAVDMQTGTSAGVMTIGVAWGFRSIDELLEAGADQIVHTTQELEKIILAK